MPFATVALSHRDPTAAGIPDGLSCEVSNRSRRRIRQYAFDRRAPSLARNSLQAYDPRWSGFAGRPRLKRRAEHDHVNLASVLIGYPNTHLPRRECRDRVRRSIRPRAKRPPNPTNYRERAEKMRDRNSPPLTCFLSLLLDQQSTPVGPIAGDGINKRPLIIGYADLVAEIRPVRSQDFLFMTSCSFNRWVAEEDWWNRRELNPQPFP